MELEKPKVQKVVIDMSHAWTPEERKQKEDLERKEKGDDNYQEQKEYPKRFASAREYIKNKISYFKQYSHDERVEMGQDWETVEGDLDCGNERTVIERLEYMADGEHGHTTAEVNLWRKAIFEISKVLNMSSYFMDAGAVGQSLYDEFTKLQDEMNKTLDENPSVYTNKDKNDWYNKVLKWQDVTNEVFYGNSKNALILLEQEIQDKVGDDHYLREKIKEAAKRMDLSIEYINKTRETILANSKKLAVYRRIRDSLYAIEFSK